MAREKKEAGMSFWIPRAVDFPLQAELVGPGLVNNAAKIDILVSKLEKG